jgi:hypothetical protein
MDTPIPLTELSALLDGHGRRVCKAGLDLPAFRIGDVVFVDVIPLGATGSGSSGQCSPSAYVA